MIFFCTDINVPHFTASGGTQLGCCSHKERDNCHTTCEYKNFPYTVIVPDRYLDDNVEISREEFLVLSK